MASINISLDSATENKNRGFIYRDIDFSFILGDNGYDFKTYDDLNSIRNGLKNIFSWRRGERIILPEFGNLLYFYLYEDMSDQTLKNLQVDVKKMITRWEPRILIQKINITPFPDSNEIMIEITYNIPTLVNEVFAFSTVLNDIDK